jgi:hypothetical protein
MYFNLFYTFNSPKPSPTTYAKPRNTNRGSLPKHLPRIEEVLAPDSTICSCGAERHVIGEDASERLDIINVFIGLILIFAVLADIWIRQNNLIGQIKDRWQKNRTLPGEST